MTDFEQKIQLAIWGALAGGFVSVLVNLLFTVLAPRLRRWNLTRHVSILPDPTHGGHARFRVINGGYWTISEAMLYLSLDASPEDVLPVPNGWRAHIEPHRFVPVSGDQMCWSVRNPVPNPMKVSIYAKERQPFSLCHIENDRITIPSEEGWPPVGHARVLLRRRRYTGVLKLVSADTNGCYFGVTIDPNAQLIPATIERLGFFERRRAAT
jgi:hypothetical protein